MTFASVASAAEAFPRVGLLHRIEPGCRYHSSLPLSLCLFVSCLSFSFSFSLTCLSVSRLSVIHLSVWCLIVTVAIIVVVVMLDVMDTIVMQQLVFGHNFNRPIVGMKEWPASLVLLSFGYAFNQTVIGVALPPRLEVSYFTQTQDAAFFLLLEVSTSTGVSAWLGEKEDAGEESVTVSKQPVESVKETTQLWVCKQHLVPGTCVYVNVSGTLDVPNPANHGESLLESTRTAARRRI